MIRMIRGDKGDEDDKGDKEKSVYSSIGKPWTPPVYSRSKEGTRSNTPTCGEVGGFPHPGWIAARAHQGKICICFAFFAFFRSMEKMASDGPK